ncbi:MAG: resolvase [Alkalinema sp. CACIAM 70d]|nr:MAG: resolvase [Alkalinema sp. CACIAM 70d]
MQSDFSASLPSAQTELMDIDAVQQALGRSRASVYRYTNTDPDLLNPPYDAKRLNPEIRANANEPLLFHPNEVARFAKDVLRVKQVTIEVQNRPPDATQELLQAILVELQAIHHVLKHPPDRRGSTSE